MLITALIDAIGTRLRQRRTCRELARLDDRSLRDIGLDRSEITSAAYGRD